MKIVVSLSGGIDSSVVLSMAKEKGDVLAVFFLYGQKNMKWEADSVGSISCHYKVPLQVIDLCAVMKNYRSALLSPDVDIPKTMVNDVSQALTIVPNRNMIFLSILTGVAMTERASQVWMGMHDGDSFTYHDCRREFVRAMKESVNLSTNNKIDFITPFISWKKSDIVKEGLIRKVPFHLTRSCYEVTKAECGVCGACRSKKDSFAVIS